MKKVYCQPEWKLTFFETEDVITASNGDGSYWYGEDLSGDAEIWDW